MAPRSQSDEDKRCFSVVIVTHGGPQLEGSQQSSTPGHASDQAWNRRRAQAPTQDNETRILGEESDRKIIESF